MGGAIGGGAWPPCPLPLNPPLPLFTPLIVCVFTASEVTTYGGIEICILLLFMGGAIGGAMAPPIIWLGGAYCIWPPQYFALEFKI